MHRRYHLHRKIFLFPQFVVWNIPLFIVLVRQDVKPFQQSSSLLPSLELLLSLELLSLPSSLAFKNIALPPLTSTSSLEESPSTPGLFQHNLVSLLVKLIDFVVHIFTRNSNIVRPSLDERFFTLLLVPGIVLKRSPVARTS